MGLNLFSYLSSSQILPKTSPKISCLLKFRGPILRVTPMIWTLTNQRRVFKYCWSLTLVTWHVFDKITTLQQTLFDKSVFFTKSKFKNVPTFYLGYVWWDWCNVSSIITIKYKIHAQFPTNLQSLLGTIERYNVSSTVGRLKMGGWILWKIVF